MGLRISRNVADRLLGGWNGIDASRPLALAGAQPARELAARLSSGSGDPVSAGRLRGTLELARIVRRALEQYFDARPELLDRLLADLSERAGAEAVRAALTELARDLLGFDPESAAATGTAVDLREALFEAILVWTLDSNPVTAPVSRALQGAGLRNRPEWQRLMEGLAGALDQAPALDGRSPSLGASLRAVSSGESLPEQIRSLLAHDDALEAADRAGLLGSLDQIAEEERPRFPPGPGPPEIPDLKLLEDATPPKFSKDRDWMEHLVLIAKNAFVWLDQLSREYGRKIQRLDQIPDAELERLAGWGVSGLWLIGVWERSPASAEIKRRLGNPQALASAYSLRDYEIADELGGEAAVHELAERAERHGIRLASDMVPNHMGIDSRWLIERPELFLSVPDCPFPAYSFDGPDLSPVPHVGIYLEDHYWDRSDAAVVFKRVDRDSGEVRYVYHGNDGTSTPWNDTAQLDYLSPQTREAVMGTILRVAGLFPVIRFDAAMTLARRHVQRLWYPEPGRGGAIPSRSDHALARHEFHQAMPTEFWRDVVDRIAEERPNTLLLAEAFWLMEGYFVRSLGMHRVYNSAFMNLLHQGETAKLAGMIGETLAFDPQILKRHVNFLSNPDEEPAIEQFGSGDRYFGACVVMSTLPGLPMIAHGQFEGYHEKYGMEFDRARIREEPDRALLERHARQVFPLLRQRHRFADVENFRLLELVEGGRVNGNVLAYANGRGAGRSIVVFNNSPKRIRGALPGAADLLDRQRGSVIRFRDLTSGLGFLTAEESLSRVGLALELEPFESRVLVDFRPVERVDERPYLELGRRLDGRGALDLELEVELLAWEPMIEALEAIVEEAARPADEGEEAADDAPLGAARLELESAAGDLEAEFDREALARGLECLAAARELEQRLEDIPWPASARMGAARQRITSLLDPDGSSRGALLALLALSAVKGAFGPGPAGELARRLLGRLTSATPDEVPVLALALDEEWTARRTAPGRAELTEMWERWVEHPEAGRLLGRNRHEGEDWVSRERVDSLLDWRGLTAVCGWMTAAGDESEVAVAALAWLDAVELLRGLLGEAGYAVERARERLTRPPRSARPRPAERPAGGGAGTAEDVPEAKPARRGETPDSNRSS